MFARPCRCPPRLRVDPRGSEPRAPLAPHVGPDEDIVRRGVFHVGVGVVHALQEGLHAAPRTAHAVLQLSAHAAHADLTAPTTRAPAMYAAAPAAPHTRMSVFGDCVLRRQAARAARQAAQRSGAGARHGVRVAQAALRHVRERRGQPHAAAATGPPRVDERHDGRRRQQRHHRQAQPRRQRCVAALEEHVAQHDVRAKGLPRRARRAFGAWKGAPLWTQCGSLAALQQRVLHSLFVHRAGRLSQPCRAHAAACPWCLGAHLHPVHEARLSQQSVAVVHENGHYYAPPYG